jgi:RNA polymerase sigma-70 factor (ECF subfamily)
LLIVTTSLTQHFVPHLPPPLRDQADAAGPALELALKQLVRKARQAALPLDELDPAQLLAYVAERLPEGGELLKVLERLCVEDLALAMACAEGNTEAIAQLERQHFGIIDVALAKMPDAQSHKQEIKQQLRQRLFVHTGERQPRIAQYSGRGELRSWLRVAAVRCAINLLKSPQGREVELQDEMLAKLAAPEENQELTHLKEKYRAEFKQAFEASLGELTSRQRNVLRYHYLERLNIDQIGAIYGVHRTTVARWLAKTREDLLAATRRSLMAQLSIERTEFDSIMRLIQSQLDASIERFLETRPDAETEES